MPPNNRAEAIHHDDHIQGIPLCNSSIAARDGSSAAKIKMCQPFFKRIGLKIKLSAQENGPGNEPKRTIRWVDLFFTRRWTDDKLWNCGPFLQL